MYEDWVGDIIEMPEILSRVVTGQVVTIDNFGNLITNIARDDLSHIKEPQVLAGVNT